MYKLPESRKSYGSTTVSRRKVFYVYANFEEGFVISQKSLARGIFKCLNIEMIWHGEIKG